MIGVGSSVGNDDVYVREVGGSAMLLLVVEGCAWSHGCLGELVFALLVCRHLFVDTRTKSQISDIPSLPLSEKRLV